MSFVRMSSIFAVALVVVCLHQVDALPYRTLFRQKRISDQRLAELETLIALSKMKNKMVTIPVGFGRVDPLRIGRKRRSVEELLKVLLPDASSDEGRGEEMASREEARTDWVYDDTRRIARYRHLPVRLPE